MGLAEQMPQQWRGEVEGHVRCNVMNLVTEPVGQHVGLHDGGAPPEPAPQSIGSSRIELQRRNRCADGEQGLGERAVPGPELEDGIRGRMTKDVGHLGREPPVDEPVLAHFVGSADGGVRAVLTTLVGTAVLRHGLS